MVGLIDTGLLESLNFSHDQVMGPLDFDLVDFHQTNNFDHLHKIHTFNLQINNFDMSNNITQIRVGLKLRQDNSALLWSHLEMRCHHNL